MLDPRLIKERPEELKKMLGPRADHIDWDSLLKLDKERRALLTKVEELRAQRRKVSDDIATLKRQKQPAEALMENMKGAGDRIKVLEEILRAWPLHPSLIGNWESVWESWTSSGQDV